MRKLILIAMLVGCGGSVASVDPSGAWLMTDTAKAAGCAAVAPETITVVASGSEHSIQGYAMDASWCGQTYCELQGTANGAHRDVVFYSDSTASGNRTDAAGCIYATSGQRAH